MLCWSENLKPRKQYIREGENCLECHIILVTVTLPGQWTQEEFSSCSTLHFYTQRDGCSVGVSHCKRWACLILELNNGIFSLSIPHWPYLLIFISVSPPSGHLKEILPVTFSQGRFHHLPQQLFVSWRFSEALALPFIAIQLIFWVFRFEEDM